MQSKYFFKNVLKQSPGGVLQKNVLLEISQNSQKNTCARVSFLIKLQEKPLVAASERFIQSNEAKIFNISINILIRFLTLRAF